MTHYQIEMAEAAKNLRNALSHPSLFTVNDLVERAERFLRAAKQVPQHPRGGLQW